MKNIDNRWLYISAYIDKNIWHLFFKDAVDPFFNMLFYERNLVSFRIQFNYSGGDNIRLALLVPDKMKHKTAKRADLYFKTFFEIKRLLPQFRELPYEVIFLPYPQNTLQYGLYSFEKIQNLDQFFILDKVFSECILAVFCESPIDVDMIITFGFYVLMDSFKLIKASNLSLANGWVEFYKSLSLSIEINEMDHSLIQNKYKESSLSLSEIYLDVHNFPLVEGLNWLHNWEIAFTKTLQIMSDKNQEGLIINKLNNLVNEQLGLNDWSSNLLNSFIYKTILNNDSQLND